MYHWMKEFHGNISYNKEQITIYYSYLLGKLYIAYYISEFLLGLL